MPELPFTFGNERTLLALLLLAGHVLADFVFQSRWMAENKPHSKRALAAHALEVGVVQVALVLWFAWHPLALVYVALIAGTHFGIDAAKLRLDACLPRWRMSWFWLDQAVHLAVLAFVWSSWPESESPEQPSDYPWSVAWLSSPSSTLSTSAAPRPWSPSCPTACATTALIPRGRLPFLQERASAWYGSGI